MKEAGRRCHRCQYRWYATRPGPGPGKPRWYDEMGSFWTDGQARMARRVSNHDRHQQQVAAFEKCPNCGSMNVKTDKSRNFVPTAQSLQQPSPGASYTSHQLPRGIRTRRVPPRPIPPPVCRRPGRRYGSESGGSTDGIGASSGPRSSRLHHWGPSATGPRTSMAPSATSYCSSSSLRAPGRSQACFSPCICGTSGAVDATRLTMSRLSQPRGLRPRTNDRSALGRILFHKGTGTETERATAQQSGRRSSSSAGALQQGARRYGGQPCRSDGGSDLSPAAEGGEPGAKVRGELHRHHRPVPPVR